MHRVYKSSGASEDEIQAMRAALAEADIRFTERPGSMFGGGQAGLWVADAKTAQQARQVIGVAQELWAQHARSNPDSVESVSIFGRNKTLVWALCIIVVVLNAILMSELFFGW